MPSIELRGERDARGDGDSDREGKAEAVDSEALDKMEGDAEELGDNDTHAEADTDADGDKDTLPVRELLGDNDALPAILEDRIGDAVIAEALARTECGAL